MKIVDSLGSLVDDIPSMLVSDHIFSDEGIEINIHEPEENVDISFLIGFNDLLQFYNIGMLELLQKHDFSVSPLGVG